MKKLHLFISALLVPAMLFAVELTSEQKNKARDVVGLYCDLLSDYARSRSYVSNNPKIQQLFSSSNTEIYDDILTENRIYIREYLQSITIKYDHSLTFTYENINSVKIETLEAPSPDKYSTNLYARLNLEKTIDGAGFYKKKVKNIFIVNPSDYKIYTIFISDSVPDQISDQNVSDQISDHIISDQFSDHMHLMIKGTEYYTAKKYESALKYYKKAGEMGNPEAMYFCGVMYFLNKGCSNERDEKGKKLNRTKRDALAYEWYKKAEQHGHEEAHRQIMIFYF